jgi:4-hydroxy-tetrahydrodipicolinate synthase
MSRVATDSQAAPSLTRRGFLREAGVAAVSLATTTEPAAARRGTPLSPDAVKSRIRGPILTLPTPFTASYRIDHQAIRNMVRMGVANGVQVYELTAGNSQYSSLTFDEVKQLTRSFVEAVAGRGVVIAATGPWWTGQSVDYARFAESVGADALQVFVPACSDDAYLAHVRRVARATRLPIVLQGDPKPALLQRLVEIPSVVSMKEDGTDEYFPAIQKQFDKRLAIFCGGQKRRYLLAQPHGSPAFFSFFITFAPAVTRRFWAAIQRGDIAAAQEVVDRYEKPVFDLCLGGPRSFMAYWHGLMEHFGVARRWVRPPDESCTSEDMRRIAALCDRLGLQPKP